MRRLPRLVLDTNVIVSAVLWLGKPAQLPALAGEEAARLYTSNHLLEELQLTLDRPKLARAVEATGLGSAEIVANYRRLATIRRPAALQRAIAQDPDDDHVIACGVAARADFVVSGDKDLLELGEAEGVRIISVADLLAELR